MKKAAINKGNNIFVCIAAFFVVCIWGVTFVQTKILINAGLRPEEIFFYRFLLAYVLVLPIAGKRLFLNNWRDEFIALGAGITGGSLYFVTENSALVYGYCSNVSLLVCVTPLTTAILVGYLFPKERMGMLSLLCSLLALFGVVLVVFNGNFILQLSPFGDFLAFAACLCWTVYSVLMKYLQPRYDTLLLTRKVFGYGILTIQPLFIDNPPDFELLFSGGLSVLVNILMLGCVASMLCYSIWNIVLKRLGTVRATNFIYFNPIVTMIVSWYVLNECITWIAILGAVMVLSGMYMAEYFRRKTKYT